MRQGTSWIYYYILDLPQHVSASGCHLHGLVSALEATQAMSVLWRIRIMFRPVWPVVMEGTYDPLPKHE
jgi:hypothetical protein